MLEFWQKNGCSNQHLITHSTWVEARFIFLHEIAQAISEREIHDELVINVDQTQSNFVPTDNITMAEKGMKNIARKGKEEGRDYCHFVKDSEW